MCPLISIKKILILLKLLKSKESVKKIEMSEIVIQKF